MISRMADPIPHTRRPANGSRRTPGPWVTLRTRVSPVHRRLVELGADARGLSLARYVEYLIEQDEVAQELKAEEDAAQEYEERLTG